jgi:hypothetical protein
MAKCQHHNLFFYGKRSIIFIIYFCQSSLFIQLSQAFSRHGLIFVWLIYSHEKIQLKLSLKTKFNVTNHKTKNSFITPDNLKKSQQLRNKFKI